MSIAAFIYLFTHPSSNAMATSVELLAILEELADGDFKKFKWLLQQAEVLEGFPAIPKSQLENADRMDTVSEIADTFDRNATEVCIKVLKTMKKNDLVQRLSNINSTSKGKKGGDSMRKKVKYIYCQNYNKRILIRPKIKKMRG